MTDAEKLRFASYFPGLDVDQAVVTGEASTVYNFFALQLYDAMQWEKVLLVQYEPGDERIREGEQGRAHRTVQAYFANR